MILTKVFGKKVYIYIKCPNGNLYFTLNITHNCDFVIDSSKLQLAASEQLITTNIHKIRIHKYLYNNNEYVKVKSCMFDYPKMNTV